MSDSEETAGLLQLPQKPDWVSQGNENIQEKYSTNKNLVV